MKRTCAGCKALESTLMTTRCGLFFPINTTTRTVGPYLLTEHAPVIQCPKPRTNADYVSQRRALDGR